MPQGRLAGMMPGRVPGIYDSRARLGCDTSRVRVRCYHSDIIAAIWSNRRVMEQIRYMQQPEECARLLCKPLHCA